MPVLGIADQEGRMTDNALAVFLSTMHFPSSEDKEKRGQLADYYRSLKLLSKLDLDDDPQEDQMRYLRPSEIKMLRRGRDLSELVPDLKSHFRDGFLAGHWLTFRVFASQNDPVLNANNRWHDYASAFFGSRMPVNGWAWPSESTDLRAILKRFGPVAHLWAAVTYDGHFRRNLIRQREITALPKVSWAVISGHGATRLAGLAQGYHRKAIAAGLFDDPRSGLQLEDMWTIPAAIPASPVTVDHPDHLLEVDFDVLKEGYVPPTLASKESRAERRIQAIKAARVVRMPEPERVEDKPPMADAAASRPLLRRPVPPRPL